ncbi:hypothetical protein OHS71_41230 (plasmid) [Streptomyces sp. NBC_00377]|nr:MULTISPECIES: hypothetical protein [unclassified Streptomyces]
MHARRSAGPGRLLGLLVGGGLVLVVLDAVAVDGPHTQWPPPGTPDGGH